MSLRLKILAAFAYVLVLVLIALEIPLALSLSNRVEAEVKSQAAAQAQVVAAAASGRLTAREQLEELVRDAGRDLGARVIVVNQRGRLLADSAGTGLRLTSYANRPEIASALAGNAEQSTRHSATLGGDFLYTAVPVVDRGRPVGAVRITQSVAEVGERERRNVLVVVGVGLAALALGLAIAWVLAGSLAGPLRGLARTARRVEEGELDARADVTTGAREQREVAVAFNDMTDRLAQALEAQREFVGNASHQLRTPLTGLRLRLEAAGLKTTDPAVEHDLQLAEAEVARLTRLLNALLTLAREGDRPALRAPVSLRHVAEAALERWQPRADETGHRLELEGDGDAFVRAGEEDVAIVVDNLLENALVYSPPGTTVTIAWRGDGRLAVLDEGPGVPPGEERRLFERFRRGHADRPGTGLGLAIVETLARRWGGAASISTRPEGGARAEVTFPVDRTARHDLEEATLS
ncbi:MAG TPA: HAMP domain-containing sensor histidine kinase [Gaiellaceae bacterium]